MRKLTKIQKAMVAIIESEGGRILDTRQGAKHKRIDYTFDGVHTHTQTLPNGKSVEHRWERNFRSAIRKTKPEA